MPKKWNDLWKYIVGGGTVLGYQAFFERVMNKAKIEENAEIMKEIRDTTKDTNAKITEFSESVNKNVMLSEQERCNQNYDVIWNRYQKLLKDYNESDKSNDKVRSMFEDYITEMQTKFHESKECYDNLNKIIDDYKKNKFMGENIIVEKINEFNQYLSSLSITEICLVINMLSSIFIFLCLISIIFAVYGNFFIEKLSLEKKYPKLSFFIRLRVKLQHSFIISNTLFILVALILMFIVNFINFTNF